MSAKNELTAKDLRQLRDAFAELHTALTAAYWAAGTMGDKDQIRGVQEVVYDILTDLNRADIASRAEELKALKTEIDAATARLETLKDEIDDIVKSIEVASDVVKGIEKVLQTAARLVV
ncbi:MAG: hypothetical protein KJZ69_01900 [Phycisphaerales bacterium]|nr:hypothetical protein [Phycisphaerales bacterium]